MIKSLLDEMADDQEVQHRRIIVMAIFMLAGVGFSGFPI